MTRKKDTPPEEDDREKQERVIHTRVSERLEQELKDRASALGVSVSNLVRNVLDNAFDLVEDIVADSARVASSASSGWRAVKGSRPPEPTVIGWQELVMNINAVCTRCNAILPRGAHAAIAIVSGSGDRPIVCASCLEEIKHGEPDPETERRKR
ncbi:MAG TPA: hypothetical protein VL463_16810 [Kofleriaceae bacterium]|nr:hypothetical protein [Kofleriaceae bacterium]